MTIKEFLEKTKNITDLKEILEVRTYIPVSEKKVIFDIIFDKCLMVEDGVLKCDYITMKTTFELAMVKYHTNLEVDIMSEDDYDDIRWIINEIHRTYLDDYSECETLFDGIKKEIYLQYSVESSIAKLSHQVLRVVENLANTVSKKIEGFDIGFEGEEFDKFKNLLNKYGK